MTQDEINRRSKVLAEFEGYKMYTNPDNGYTVVFVKKDLISPLEKWAKYHTDWEELHRVWEKFRDTRLEEPSFEKIDRRVLWLEHIKDSFMHGSKLDAFIALSDAVEWYNSIKEK